MVDFVAADIKGVTEYVYDALKRKILSYELRPEQRLDVSLISEQLGVSRTPVKDALQRLSAQGLIEIRPRKGTFVAKITVKDVEETLEVRQALEGKACELAAGRIDGSVLSALRVVNSQMFGQELTMEENLLLNGKFHQLIVQSSENELLIKMYSELSSHLQILQLHFRPSTWRVGAETVVEEHNQIILALAENKPLEASKIVQCHVENSMRRLIEEIQETERFLDDGRSSESAK